MCNHAGNNNTEWKFICTRRRGRRRNVNCLALLFFEAPTKCTICIHLISNTSLNSHFVWSLAKCALEKSITEGTDHCSIDHILRLPTSLINYTSWIICNIANGFLCRRWRQCFKDVPSRIPLVTLCTDSHMTRVGLCVRNHMTRKLNNINDRQFICKKSHDSTSEWRVESKKNKSVRRFAISSRFYSSKIFFVQNGQTWRESWITVNLCTLRCTLIETNNIFKSHD